MTVSVVIADDHRVVQEGLTLLLESTGDYQVIGTAETGPEAVAMLTDLRPDVAIVDLLMPGFDGVEVTRLVRERGLNMKILILSMVGAEERIHASLSAGADGYMIKDGAGDELIDALHTICAGHRFLSAVSGDIILDGQIVAKSSQEDCLSLDELSARERQVFRLVAEGQTSAEIAMQLGLASSTVDTYRSRLMQKLGAQSIADLVRLAIRLDIISA